MYSVTKSIIASNSVIENGSAMDSGLFGKAAECRITSYINNRVITKVKAQGKTDASIKRISYEIKTGTGEIDGILAGATKFVIYAPNARDIESLEDYRVIPTAEFVDMVKGLGLVYADKTSAKNGSKPKMKLKFAWLDKSGEWLRKSQGQSKGLAFAKALKSYPTLTQWLG